MRQSRSILANTEALSRVLLSHLVAVGNGVHTAPAEAKASEDS
jgi:hypothetical protein